MIKEIIYLFDSAWAPPCEWLRKTAKQWPTLKFKLKYEEGGMGFKGTTKARGDEFEDKCFDI